MHFLDNFQRNINEIAGNKFLRFAIDIWDPKNKIKDDIEHDKITINDSTNFPFLDIELFYNIKDNLKFKVHLKENQKLKCLNKLSAHAKACFKAIPKSVCKRLARLTTMTNNNKDKKINEVHPNHINALLRAELIKNMNKLPTFQDELNRENKKKKKKENDTCPRNVFFCVGHSKFWKTPMPGCNN